MKKLLILVLLFCIVFLSYPLSKPVKGKGAMILKMEVNMLKKFFSLEKGVYKDSILVLIYNMHTGKKYEGYINDGYVHFLKLEPGTYEAGYWSLKGDMSEFGDYLDKKNKVRFEVKPDTFTVMDEYKVSVTYKEEINNWESFQGQLDTQVTTEVNKKSREEIKKYFLEDIDTKKLWKDIPFI